MIGSICSEPKVLEVTSIVNTIITIIKISVPILLIISLSIDFTKATASNDSDALEKTKKNAVSKAIAAALVFFIPTFVGIIANITLQNSDYKNCLKSYSKEEIQGIYISREEEYTSKAEESIDINDYKRETLNKNILYISQQEVLFNDTLYNNLSLDNNNYKSLREITSICNIENIMDTNLKYNTLIEENGSNLSGGERQRIVLARTLLRHFNILIIDEGLSEVDIDTERKILKKLFRKYKDKTIILISHRLDNMDIFDSVLRFNNSKIFKVFKNV